MKTKLVRLLLLVLLSPLPLPALTVALDDRYPPYSFRAEDGHLQGIAVDLWNLWSRKTGVPVLLQGLSWSDAIGVFEKGHAEVLDTVFLNPERKAKWLFTDSYATVSTSIFHREGLAGLRSVSDLKGFLVGVKAGDAGANPVRAQAGVVVKEYPDYESLVDAAACGEILVFCMDETSARHFLLAKTLDRQFRRAFVVSEDGFRRAVLRSQPEILVGLDRGFSQITTAESQEITRRWTGSPVALDEGVAPWIFGIAGGVVLLLVLLVVWLRAQVRRRSGQLAGTEERLKVSEDRARALIAALPDQLFVIDRVGTILETQSSFRNHLYHNPERFVGQTIAEVFGPEVAADADRKLATLDEQGGTATVEASLEIRGEPRQFEARIVRLADGRYLSIVRDVSVLRRAWQDDLHRNKLESMGVMAGGLAHDFNNNLGVIQGFVSLARIQLSQPEKALASLDKAVQATRRAAGLTGQLRVLAHGGEVQRTLVSVRSLAEEAASFALVGSACVLAVEADFGPWTVDADPDQLSQVFHNLALNAVQSMSAGTVTLVFRNTGTEVQVAVVDEGEGIPEGNRSRLFDPYFTTKPKGTGLGLSVVHAVVQRHGGSLTVESRVGQGSVFTVALPAAQGVPQERSGRPRDDLASFLGQRALVMEDEADLRTLLVEVCSGLGFDVTATRNGTEALVACDEARAVGRPFTLLVSDLLVPGDMGGRELVSRLRRRPEPFRALAVTGFSVDRSREDFQNQGFDVIVGKPFTIDELKHRIVELMKSPWKIALSN